MKTVLCDVKQARIDSCNLLFTFLYETYLFFSPGEIERWGSTFLQSIYF